MTVTSRAACIGGCISLFATVVEYNLARKFLRIKHIELPKPRLIDHVGQWDENNWEILSATGFLYAATQFSRPRSLIGRSPWYTAFGAAGVAMGHIVYSMQVRWGFHGVWRSKQRQLDNLRQKRSYWDEVNRAAFRAYGLYEIGSKTIANHQMESSPASNADLERRKPGDDAHNATSSASQQAPQEVFVFDPLAHALRKSYHQSNRWRDKRKKGRLIVWRATWRRPRRWKSNFIRRRTRPINIGNRRYSRERRGKRHDD
ncbi:hypothetical protein Q7P37_009340 [Cladosporium fusiforme]